VKTRTIHDIWIRILWFVSTLANSFKANELKVGRNATDGSLTIIEHLHRILPKGPDLLGIKTSRSRQRCFFERPAKALVWANSVDRSRCPGNDFLIARRCFHRLRQLGFKISRHNGVHLDIKRGQLCRHRFGQLDQSPLPGAVSWNGSGAKEGIYAGVVDDFSLALLHHRLSRKLSKARSRR
jgi:hypothetical protein